MKAEYIDALKVGGFVLMLAAIGLGLFLYSGSMSAIALFGLGIPIILLGLGIAYQRRVSSTDTGESPKLRSMTQDLAADVESMLATYNRLDRSPHWNPGDFSDTIRDIGRELENRGIEIHESDGSYNVTVERVEMGPGAINRYRQRVESIQDALVSEYRQYIETQQEAINRQFELLISEGLLPQDATLGDEGDYQTASLSELEHVVRERQEAFKNRLWEAINRLREGPGQVSFDTQRIEAEIEAGRYEDAVDRVLEARETIEETGQARFESNRGELIGLIEDIQSSKAARYCSHSHLERLTSIKQSVESLDSVFQESDLKQERQRTLETGRDIIADLESTLIEYIDELNSEDLPADYYERPSIIDRDNIERVEQASDLRNFQQRWETVVSELVEALDQADTRRGALVAYDDVVGDIEAALSENGEVLPADVPYRPAEHVMAVYAARNEDVTFLETGPKLTHSAEIAGGEFDLTVRVELEPAGTETVDLTVDAPTDAKERTATIEGKDTFVFKSIRGGDVHVTASTESKTYTQVGEQIRLDRNQEVSLVLQETTARERICGDLEDESRALLDEVAMDVTRTHQQEGYLDSDMTFGVKSEYVPCLLALWAEQENLAVWEGDDRIMVYDRDRLANQLTNLLEHKLESGDSIDFETIRETYLTVPAPDGLISDVIREEQGDDSLTFTDTEVVKG